MVAALIICALLIGLELWSLCAISGYHSRLEEAAQERTAREHTSC